MDKKLKILKMVEKYLNKRVIKIRELAELIGTLVAACPAVAYGWLFYKQLEMIKQDFLKLEGYESKKNIKISDGAIDELKWWKEYILPAENKIRTESFDLEIFSDASLTGWGVVCNNSKASGFWNSQESKYHINYLEIKAALLGLKCFAKSLRDKQILLRIDNLTALAYINKMGGTRSIDSYEIAKELWQWCFERKIWVFAEYIASKVNPADEGSRLQNIDTEWELAQFAYDRIVKKFGKPDIDLFASRVNKKCNKYCSWERDPEAWVINALTINWKNFFWYAFPPFSLILKILRKVKEERSRGIIVVPHWTGKPWYPMFKELLISEVISFAPSDNNLLSPCRKRIHPLASQITLIAGVLSGKHSR